MRRAIPLKPTISALVLMVATSMGGCRPETPQKNSVSLPSGRVPVPTARRFLPAEWKVVWQVGGSGPNDTTVIRPAMVRASHDNIILYDFGASQVVIFAPGGQLLAKLGRRGAGPGEFGRIIDFAVDSTSKDLLLLDIQNSRIAKADLATHDLSERQVRLSGYATGIVPLDSLRALVVNTQYRSALQEFGADGSLVRTYDFPWSGAEHVPELARQAYVATDGTGRWVYAYVLAGAWFPFDHERFLGIIGSTIGGPESFPDVTRDARRKGTTEYFGTYTPCRTCDLALDGDNVYILAGGSSDTQKRVIDVYDFTTGRYLRSYRLPLAATFFTVRGSRLFLTVEDPYPALMAYDLPMESLE